MQYWDHDSSFGRLTIASEQGVVHAVVLPQLQPNRLPPKPNATPDQQLASAFDAWLSGTTHQLTVPFALGDVTDFTARVLECLSAGPAWGETWTYGELAAAIGKPGAARAVGTALSKNPVPLLVPCHRIVAGDGTLGGFGGSQRAVALKAALLAREGVFFTV